MARIVIVRLGRQRAGPALVVATTRSVSTRALVDLAADAILKYNSRLLLYYFVILTYNADQIQNNRPLTTDFWRKHLVNCIGYSILKLFPPSFPINHHARAPRYGRGAPQAA